VPALVEPPVMVAPLVPAVDEPPVADLSPSPWVAASEQATIPSVRPVKIVTRRKGRIIGVITPVRP
jgi:hypothetical protein